MRWTASPWIGRRARPDGHRLTKPVHFDSETVASKARGVIMTVHECGDARPDESLIGSLSWPDDRASAGG